LAVLLPIGLAAVGSVAPAAAQETKPNILFIMGDDIGWMQPSIYHEGLAVGETWFMVSASYRRRASTLCRELRLSAFVQSMSTAQR